MCDGGFPRLLLTTPQRVAEPHRLVSAAFGDLRGVLAPVLLALDVRLGAGASPGSLFGRCRCCRSFVWMCSQLFRRLGLTSHNVGTADEMK